MTATTPRRAITCGSCPDGLMGRRHLAGLFPGDPHDASPVEAHPKRPAPRRAVLCAREPGFIRHDRCIDGHHARYGSTYEKPPARAVYEGPWIATEGPFARWVI